MVTCSARAAARLAVAGVTVTPGVILATACTETVPEPVALV